MKAVTVALGVAAVSIIGCGAVSREPRPEPSPNCPSRATAVAIRASGTPDPKQVVACQEMSLAEALATVGQEPGALDPRAERVWLVKVDGPYAISAQIRVPNANHYWVIVDASDMQIRGTGTGPAGSEW